MEHTDLKERIYAKARDLGANLVRSCAASKWEEQPIQSAEFDPRYTWPWVKNVIVLGIPLFGPMMDTAPSMVYQELYDTSNRVLDEIAFKLTAYITAELGHRALFFPRDCYYSIDVLLKNPNASFSHVIAGYYAGMGTIGDCHNLLTHEFGPRLRVVSILTDAPIDPDPMLEEDLCLHCGKCMRVCPSHSFSENPEGGKYLMDKIACTQYHVDIKNQNHWPCGLCASQCPVGEDLKRYRGEPVVTKEGIAHTQAYGS